MGWLTTITAAPKSSRCDPCTDCPCPGPRPGNDGGNGGFSGGAQYCRPENGGVGSNGGRGGNSGCYPRGHHCYGWVRNCGFQGNAGGNDGGNGSGSVSGGSGGHP
ncbi:hypothetical protein FRB95_011440 [Tulasnella sp. JGI-2019a]|nr:hypothetical protein FRB95_011440 [Tulasnella sp. JGI-2019a]